MVRRLSLLTTSVLEVKNEKIFISSSFPDEYVGSESRLALKGAVAKAKANAAQGIPELIQLPRMGNTRKIRKRSMKRTLNTGGIGMT